MAIEVDFNKTDEDELYEMALHETKKFNDGDIYVTRVIGGWIYEIRINSFEESRPVFVPFKERGVK